MSRDLGPNDPRVCLPLDAEEIELLIRLIDDDDRSDADEEQLRGLRRSLVARRKKHRTKMRKASQQ